MQGLSEPQSEIFLSRFWLHYVINGCGSKRMEDKWKEKKKRFRSNLFRGEWKKETIEGIWGCTNGAAN